MAKVALPPDTRRFFQTLHSVIRLNPFSDERASLLQQLTRGNAQGAWSLDPENYALTREVDRRIESLDRTGASTLGDFQDADRDFVNAAYLYQEYQRLVPRFDELIRRYRNGEGEPPPVPFATESLNTLVQRGFTREQALFSFAIAFQLRRAFYFIVDSLTGVSDSMRRLREQLWNNVFTFDLWNYQQVMVEHLEDFATLLLGKTGVGKGQAAMAIGRSGFIPFNEATNRFAVNHEQTFIAANLSRFPEGLIESELFGHRKGAFTGASSNHEGLLERCDFHGALFLDEIGEVSPSVQVKLLEVLQTRTFSRVGGPEVLRFSGRVIAATNQPLDELRAKGKFRDDFFYRLCSDVIDVPDLRQRIADTPDELTLLVARIVARITQDENAHLVDLVMTRLCEKLPPDYAWPGNVRELEQAVRGILLTGSYRGNPIFSRVTEPAHTIADDLRRGDVTGKELLARYCRMLHEQLGSYEAVARRVELDRRTVRKYVEYGDREAHVQAGARTDEGGG